MIRTTVAQTEWRKPGRCWQKEHLQHTLWWRKMWRRFLIHSIREMPTQCVPDNRCGAIFSGWLYGGHHTLANGYVSFNVCFIGGQNCCKKSINIRVKECGSYFIYNLQKGTWLFSSLLWHRQNAKSKLFCTVKGFTNRVIGTCTIMNDRDFKNFTWSTFYD